MLVVARSLGFRFLVGSAALTTFSGLQIDPLVPAEPVGTPAITNWTTFGSAGGNLVLSGANLGAGLTVFLSGTDPNGTTFLVQASIISQNSSGAVIQLPNSLPSDTIFQLSAENSQGLSNTVLVNAPQLWWVGPNEIQPGGVTSLFGRNLVLGPGDHPTVTLTMTSGVDTGETFSLGVIDANSYRVEVQIPENLPQGTYTIQYNSGAGAGGAVATSQTLAPVLTVKAASTGTNAVLNIANFGAVINSGQDAAAAFQAAMNAASVLLANGSGVTSVTIQLGAGEYDLSQSIGLPANINLEGQGAGVTTLKAMPGFNITLAPGVLYTEVTFQGGQTNLANDTIGNLAIVTNGNSPSTAVYAPGTDNSNFCGIWAPNTDNLTISNVEVLAQNATAPIFVPSVQHFALANSTIVGQQIVLGGGSQIAIYGNSFFGTNQTGAIIKGTGASDVAIYENTAQNLNPDAVGQNVLSDTSQGRFFVNQPGSGNSVLFGLNDNVYIAKNQTIGLAPFIGKAGVDANTGEQILFEGAGVTTRFALGNGLFQAATPLSLTLSPSSPDIPAQTRMVGLLTIVSGTGAGATTEVASYAPTTGTLYFDGPLPVLPDATSVLLISQAPSRVAIVNNKLDGLARDVAAGTSASASAGVEVYPGGSSVVIDGNTFRNLNTGVSLWSFTDPNGNFIGANYFKITNNTFVNVNTGVRFRDGTPPAWELLNPTIDTLSVTGTTIENNNFSSVNNSAFYLSTDGSIDTTAFNVASQNVLPANNAVVMLNGQLTGTTQAGSTVNVYDGTTLLGTTNASGSGIWSFATAFPAGADGTHSFTAVADDGAASTTLVVVVIGPN
jgi:hypothetical protein